MSLLEQLPRILEEARRQAEALLTAQPGTWPGVEDVVCLHPDTAPADWVNRLIRGDNLAVMAALIHGNADIGLPSLRGKVDVAYIDPPFESRAAYRMKTALPGETPEDPPLWIEQEAYTDIWVEGTAEYLAMLCPRLILLRELLAETGSLFVHLDWHAGHAVKLLLDEIFGRDNFRNEIIWYYPDYLQGNVSRGFPRKNDFILFYSRQAKFKFHRVKEALAQPRKRNKVFWNRDTRKMDLVRDEHGKIVYEEHAEKYCDTVWHIGQTAVTRAQSKEWLPFDTQKPLELLRRVIESTTDPGDLVLDVFGGSGTTAVAAEGLGRRWVVTEAGEPACRLIRQRLIHAGATRFTVHGFSSPSGDRPSVTVTMAPAVWRALQEGGGVLELNLIDYRVDLGEKPPNMSDESWDSITRVATTRPLDLIDAWAVDGTGNDGMRPFTTQWQAARPARPGPEKALRCPLSAEIALKRKPDSVVVRVMDCLGTMTEVHVSVLDVIEVLSV